MAYKVTNISGRVVGLNLGEGEVVVQRNLLKGEFIVLDELTEQVRTLSDPYKRVLRVSEIPKEEVDE